MSSDEKYRAIGKLIDRRMVMDGKDEDELARLADLPVDQVIPLVAGLPGPWPRSAMVGVSVGLGWPADGIERLFEGEDPDGFEFDVLGPDTLDCMTYEAARQAAVLISYIGGEPQLELLVAIRKVVDELIPGL